jgi:hypothetical protein
MVAIEHVSNKPSFKALIDRLLGREIDRTYFDRSFTRAAPSVPLAVWWTSEDAAKNSKAVWATKALGSEYMKAANYVVPAFGLIGLLTLRRPLADPRLVLLLVFVAMQALVLWALAWGIGYVSQRHTIMIVMVTCIFAIEGFFTLSVAAIRMWQAPALAKLSVASRMRTADPWVLVCIWTGIVMAVALPRNFRSLHEDRAGHKAAGLWMKDHVPADWQIVDPFGWAEWYTGRTLRAIPNPNYYVGPGLYAVFEPNAKSPHSKLEHYVPASKVKEQGELVFQYPAGVPEAQIKVAVYKSPPLKVH